MQVALEMLCERNIEGARDRSWTQKLKFAREIDAKHGYPLRNYNRKDPASSNLILVLRSLFQYSLFTISPLTAWGSTGEFKKAEKRRNKELLLVINQMFAIVANGQTDRQHFWNKLPAEVLLLLLDTLWNTKREYIFAVRAARLDHCCLRLEIDIFLARVAATTAGRGVQSAE